MATKPPRIPPKPDDELPNDELVQPRRSRQPQQSTNTLVVAFLQIFEVLTLKKVLVWTLFIFATGSAYVLYRNQDTIITGWVVKSKVIDPVLKAPTGTLLADMKRFVDLNPDVVGLQVVDVDLALNTRSTVWAYIDDTELTKLFDRYLAAKPGPTPWLSGSPDLITLTLSSAVNSTPLCIPIGETLFPKRVVGIDKFVTDLCVSPVPPPYASFSGYLSAWLKRPFDAEERQTLILQLRSFAARLQPPSSGSDFDTGRAKPQP